MNIANLDEKPQWDLYLVLSSLSTLPHKPTDDADTKGIFLQVLLVSMQCLHWGPELGHAVAKANIPAKDVKHSLQNRVTSINDKAIIHSALVCETVLRSTVRAFKYNEEVTTSWRVTDQLFAYFRQQY